jgi:tRNA dimethylallyltransferase
MTRGIEYTMQHHKTSYPKIPVVIGATASGKTALAIALAKELDAEIISADSRQIYSELTIGSAKPSPDELAQVRHHFINERSVLQPFSAGDFAKEASARIKTIFERGKRVVVVGGSALYVRGLTQGFSELPNGDRAVRERLYDELRKLGSEKLYERLQHLDAARAATLDHTKTQRLIRSLEVIEVSGEKMSDLQETCIDPEFEFDLIGLDLPREKLYARINERTDAMMTHGFLDEATTLYKTFGEQHRTSKINALETVGYKELFDYLSGACSLEAATELIKQHTRNYAKRQLTFFRNKFSARWIAVPESESERAFASHQISSILIQR